jgi:hypothetical protein
MTKNEQKMFETKVFRTRIIFIGDAQKLLWIKHQHQLNILKRGKDGILYIA